VHPQAEQESIFRTFLLGGEDLEVHLVVLDRLLKVTTEKVVTFFRGKKCASDTILATPLCTINDFFVDSCFERTVQYNNDALCCKHVVESSLTDEQCRRMRLRETTDHARRAYVTDSSLSRTSAAGAAADVGEVTFRK